MNFELTYEHKEKTKAYQCFELGVNLSQTGGKSMRKNFHPSMPWLALTRRF